MNRRRFLKYTGVAAAVVGVGALGVDYLINLELKLPTQTTTRLKATTSTATPNAYSNVTRFPIQGAFLENVPTGYDSDQTRLMIRHLADLRANWIVGQIALRQDCMTSTEVRFQDPSYAASLKSLTRYAQQLGMKVAWYPNIIGGNEISWRGGIQPSDVNSWFTSYGNKVGELAALANQLNVSLFVVGSEMSSLEGYEKEWSDIISSVRSTYSGEIAYGTNGRSYKNAFIPLQSVGWFSQLDYLGFSSYWALTRKNDPSIDELVNVWTSPYRGMENEPFMPSIVQFLSDMSKKLTVPIIFTECGYRSVRGANRQPWNYSLLPSSDNSVDFNEQANCYEALFRVLSDKPWWKGLFVFAYNNDANERPNNTGYTPYRKPAESVIAKWFNPQETNR